MDVPAFAARSAELWCAWLGISPSEYAVAIGKELMEDVVSGNDTGTIVRIVYDGR